MTAEPRPLVAGDRRRVLDAYEEGVEAIGLIARDVGDWQAPTPCPDWPAVDLAGHLVAIVGYYHRLLDAAEQRAPLEDLPRGERLAAMNARDLARAAPAGGPARVDAFVVAARDHRRRLEGVDWGMTLGTWEGVGPLSVAAHTGLAVVEWHVHAWDLAQVAGRDHRPADPEIVAAGRAVLFAVPEGATWAATLASAGRTPSA